ARAVRAADRLLPGDPPQVRRDAPGGRELARRRLLLRVGPRRESGGRGARGVGRQGVCRRRRAPCLRRGDPGARRHRVHLGVRPAPLLQARESARGDVRGRRPPPRADRPAGRRVGRGRHAPLPVTAQGPPLDGIRVVDLTSYIAGSYAAMQLADMGADVVKVESPEGDAFRELPGFFGWNRGKRSISVDLKTPEGRAIVERLATGGDVFMENMRPGVAERLGVGWTRFAALNPRLVYCSVTAFGSTGPGAERPGFDPIFQALGGLMTLQGFGGPPQYLRTAPTDYYTAALATQAILAALFTRERTGRGQRVETSLLRGVLALQSGVAVDYPGKPSLVRDNPTYRLYQADDGQWFLLEVGHLRLVGQPIAFTETPTRDPGPPPTLGQHTDEILSELGYTDAEIAALRARRVLGGPRR